MTDDRAPFREAREWGKARGQQQRLERIWEQQETYQPDATECSKGHLFTSEADCVLPEDWDNFMCRTCITETVARETP